MILLLNLAVLLVAQPADIWIIQWPAFVSYWVVGGPAQPYCDCCAYVNDLDNDGDVDLHDLALLQIGWSCPSEGLCGYVYTPAGANP